MLNYTNDEMNMVTTFKQNVNKIDQTYDTDVA